MISGIDAVKNGSYTLNDGEKKEWTGGDISFTDLENGVYVLSLCCGMAAMIMSYRYKNGINNF